MCEKWHFCTEKWKNFKVLFAIFGQKYHMAKTLKKHLKTPKNTIGPSVKSDIFSLKKLKFVKCFLKTLLKKKNMSKTSKTI